MPREPLILAVCISRIPRLTPAPLDLDRTLALVEPLYQDKSLATGEPFLAHARGTAEIVAPLCNDADLLCAACLFGVHDVLREPDEWLRARFGAGVAKLVTDLRQLMKLSELTRKQSDAGSKRHGVDDQAEALRRMLLAMANDLRIVLLRLASRLQTLRYYAASKVAGPEPMHARRCALRPARQSARHLAIEVGARRSVVPLPRA